MRFLVTRSPDDAVRTGQKLAAIGHEACLAPLTRIVPTGDPLPADPCDALIVTSAHAGDALPALDRRKPVFAVGERTAEHRPFDRQEAHAFRNHLGVLDSHFLIPFATTPSRVGRVARPPAFFVTF